LEIRTTTDRNFKLSPTASWSKAYLHHLVRSGEILGAMLMTESEALGTPGGSVTPIAHLDANQTGLSRTHRLYRCSDGWLAVAARSPVEKTAFDEVAGADPERFFGERGVTRSLAALDAAGVSAAPVLQDQLNAFLDDPANAKAGLHAHYRHAVYGEMQQVGAFWDFGDLPLAIGRAPPALGEHSAEVLRMLSFDAGAVERLRDMGVTKLMTRDT